MDRSEQTAAAHHTELIASMTDQLEDLYRDRERLVEATGVQTVEDVIDLIESMRAQLDVLYAERDETAARP